MIESEELKKKLDTNLVGVIKELIDTVADHATALEYFAEADKKTGPRLRNLEIATKMRAPTHLQNVSRLEYLEAGLREMKEAIDVCGADSIFVDKLTKEVTDNVYAKSNPPMLDRLEYLEAKVKELKESVSKYEVNYTQILYIIQDI